LKFEYDKDSDIAYVRFKEGKYAFSEGMNENVIIDLDIDGKILAIEILSISKVLGRELLKKMLRAETAILT